MKFKIVIVLVALAGAIIFSSPAMAETPSGQDIAQMVYDRDIGEDSYAKIDMVLIDRRGHKRHRKLIVTSKEYGDVIKSYIRFTAPADIEGTAFLTWENKGHDDDQFLYLPALKRVRRIVASQQKSRFVNTDYTYEDMQTREVNEDHHRLTGQENYMNYECWVIESEPVKPDSSQYGKRISWIVKEINIPIKTEYFDKRGKKIKVYRAAGLEKVDGIWTATEYEMHDLEREHRTLMKINQIRYNRGLEDRMFTKTYMEYKN